MRVAGAADYRPDRSRRRMTALAHIMPGPPGVDPRADAIEREVERLRADRAWLIEQLTEILGARYADDTAGTTPAEIIIAAIDVPALHQVVKGYADDIDDL